MLGIVDDNNALPRIDDNDGEDERGYRNISIMATIDKFTYFSMPAKVVGDIHHWVDVVGVIEPVAGESEGHAMDTNVERGEWIITFKDTLASLVTQKASMDGTGQGQQTVVFRKSDRVNEPAIPWSAIS